MFLVLIDFYRTELRHVFLRRKTGEAPVRQHDNANDDENDPENASGFHNAIVDLITAGGPGSD